MRTERSTEPKVRGSNPLGRAAQRGCNARPYRGSGPVSGPSLRDDGKSLEGAGGGWKQLATYPSRPHGRYLMATGLGHGGEGLRPLRGFPSGSSHRRPLLLERVPR